MLRLRALSLDSWLVVALTEHVFRSLRALPGVPCVLAPGHADAQAPSGGGGGGSGGGGGGAGGGGGGSGGGGGGGSGGSGSGGEGAAHGLRQAGLRLGVMLALLKAGFELFACDVDTLLLQVRLGYASTKRMSASVLGRCSVLDVACGTPLLTR